MGENKKLIALTGANLIDGNGATPLRDATLLIEGNRIKAAGVRAASRCSFRLPWQDRASRPG